MYDAIIVGALRGVSARDVAGAQGWLRDLGLQPQRRPESELILPIQPKSITSPLTLNQSGDSRRWGLGQII
jgi:hypothetical protein